MDDLPILGSGDDHPLLKQFLAQYDVPAFVRRARQVQEAFDALVQRCLCQREEWLGLVRTRLGLLKDWAGDWNALCSLVTGEEQVYLLQQLHADLKPQLRIREQPTSSPRTLHRALRDLTESIERFNRRWHEFLHKVDRSHVNELRDGYNRYYLLEKECALRSSRLARQGFRRLEPVTVDELAALLPLLPIPQLK